MPYSGLPCPLCSAPVAIVPQSLGQRERCPSCGLLCLVTRIDGMVSLIPLESPSQPEINPPPSSAIDWHRILPIAIPVASLALVVTAIVAREASHALRRRREQAAVVVQTPTEASRPEVKRKATPKPVKVGRDAHLVEHERPAQAEPAFREIDDPGAADPMPQPPPDDVPEVRPAEPLVGPPAEPLAGPPAREADAFDVKDEELERKLDLARDEPPLSDRPPPTATDAPPFDEVEFFKALRGAKAKFRTTTAESLARFAQACEETVKREAKATGDLDLASVLLNDIEELKKNGKIPTRPQFEPARRTFLDERRQADRELYQVYQQTIDGLVRELQIERAIHLRDERDIFVRKEREILGMAGGGQVARPGDGTAATEKPLVIDLQNEKQVRDYAGPAAGSKVFLTIDELVYFPDGARIRGEQSTVPAGKPIVIEFTFSKGPQIEVSCIHTPSTGKIQLRVEPVFEEFGRREFDLTFPRLDKLESVSRMNLARAENEVQMLARPKYARGPGDPGGDLVVAQESLRRLQATGPHNEFPLEHARKAALTRTANLVAELSKRVQRAQGEIPALTARLNAVPPVRQFMESIHQRAEIHYTIFAERDGIGTVLVKAGQ